MMNSLHLFKIGQKLFADFEKSTNTGSDQINMKEIKKNIETTIFRYSSEVLESQDECFSTEKELKVKKQEQQESG